MTFKPPVQVMAELIIRTGDKDPPEKLLVCVSRMERTSSIASHHSPLSEEFSLSGYVMGRSFLPLAEKAVEVAPLLSESGLRDLLEEVP